MDEKYSKKSLLVFTIIFYVLLLVILNLIALISNTVRGFIMMYLGFLIGPVMLSLKLIPTEVLTRLLILKADGHTYGPLIMFFILQILFLSLATFIATYFSNKFLLDGKKIKTYFLIPGIFATCALVLEIIAFFIIVTGENPEEVLVLIYRGPLFIISMVLIALFMPMLYRAIMRKIYP